MLPICSALLLFPIVFRIKDDREARRIQVHSSRGAIQFQLWWQRPWDELSPLFPFPFLTVTECSEMKTLVLLPEVVVPELVLLLSLFNLTIKFKQHQKTWESNQMQPMPGKTNQELER